MDNSGESPAPESEARAEQSPPSLDHIAISPGSILPHFDAQKHPKCPPLRVPKAAVC